GANTTLVGVITASDKTPLTVGTGNKEMWPVVLSIANIPSGPCMKASSAAFALTAYLPIPKFKYVSKPVQAVLMTHIFHHCVSII
ncbi:hypothetical protein FIBSPDRAFT_708530, partial [Athelia psychrophila]